METGNFYVGQSIKNYKEFCKLAEEEEKNGKPRDRQIEDWKRYVNLTKEGHKFIITEIYEKPIVKVDNRKNRNVIPYIQTIKKLILDLLAQQRNGNACYSKYVLLGILKMVNDNYSVGKYNVQKVARYLELNEKNVYSFFNETSKKLVEHLEKSLEQLKNQALIIYEKEQWVQLAYGQVDLNHRGDVKVNVRIAHDEYGNEEKSYHVNTSANVMVDRRKSTKEEQEHILRVERETLLEMGYNSKKDAILDGKFLDYQKRVNETIMDELNIEFYYDKYNIRFHKEHINWEINRLEQLEKQQLQEQLNDDIIKRMNGQAIKRANKELASDWGFVGTEKEDEIEAFLTEYDKMFHSFVFKNSTSIGEEILKTKTNK